MLFSRRQPSGWTDYARGMLWPRGGLHRSALYFWHRLNRLKHHPHRVALGVAIGVFVSFTPFIGFHGPISVGLALLLRGSVIAAFLSQVVGNPVTFPLIWLACWKAGCLITGIQGAGIDFVNLSLASLWANAATLLLPLAVGGLVLGLIAAVPSYGLVRLLMAKRAAA